ncbi:MAG: fibronectin type III domain-containing protein, partial [Candidatus Hydrogenedentota bacterium]
QAPINLSGRVCWRVAANHPSGNWTAFGDSSYFVADALKPAKPTGFTAVAAILGETGVRISWNNNTETDLVGYRVYRHGSNDSLAAATLLFNGIIIDTSRIDTSVLPGETYYFFVYAVDSNGNRSDSAGGVAATTFTITKALDSTSFGPYPGSTLQYSLTFQNAGWSPADSVIVVDTVATTTAFRDTVTNIAGWEFQYATIAAPDQSFYSADYTSGVPGVPSSVRYVRWRKLLVTAGEPQAVIRYRVIVQ